MHRLEIPVGIAITFDIAKTSMMRTVKKFYDVLSYFDRTPACDRQTDGQTFWDSIVHAVHSMMGSACSLVVGCPLQVTWVRNVCQNVQESVSCH